MGIEAKIHTLSNKKNSIIIAVIACIVAALAIGFFIINATAPKTYPLGDPGKLEYIGKTSYGCWVVCDANPTEVYYYATDMKPEEVAGYFKKAHIYEGDRLQAPAAEDPSIPITFSLKNPQGKLFYIRYYRNGKTALTQPSIKSKSNNRYIISILGEQYDYAARSL
jgi:hypothetical protein